MDGYLEARKCVRDFSSVCFEVLTTLDRTARWRRERKRFSNKVREPRELSIVSDLYVLVRELFCIYCGFFHCLPLIAAVAM